MREKIYTKEHKTSGIAEESEEYYIPRPLTDEESEETIPGPLTAEESQEYSDDDGLPSEESEVSSDSVGWSERNEESQEVTTKKPKNCKHHEKICVLDVHAREMVCECP